MVLLWLRLFIGMLARSFGLYKERVYGLSHKVEFAMSYVVEAPSLQRNYTVTKLFRIHP